LAEQKRRFKAVIAGKSYTIVGPGSQAHFETVTQLLNEQLTQIHRLDPKLSREEAAMLLAFNALSDQVNQLAHDQNQAD